MFQSVYNYVYLYLNRYAIVIKISTNKNFSIKITKINLFNHCLFFRYNYYEKKKNDTS
jgi:hypothetical protein